MKAIVESKDNKTIFSLEGKVDGKTAPELQQQILPYVMQNSRILIDMTKVDYLSSAGLRLLLAIYRQANNEQAEFLLSGISEDIKDMMSITGFLKHLKVVDTKELGLKWLYGAERS